jgi:integrase
MAKIKLDTRTARGKLPAQEAPYWIPLAPGQALGYFKTAKGGAGTWRARLYQAETRAQRKTALGTADDFQEADGETVLDFRQAQAKAAEWFEGIADDARRVDAGEALHKGPYTVADALRDYFKEARRRGMKGLSRDEQRAAAWILPELGGVTVADLARTRIEAWLSKIADAPRRVRQPAPGKHVPVPRKFKTERKPKAKPEPPRPPATEEEVRARRDSANRTLTILKAALNHALDRRRARKGDAWQAVKPFRGTTKARVRFLSGEDQVRLVNACPAEFRPLVQGALLTGARYGELARIRVRDFDPAGGTVWIEPGKTGKGRHVVLTDDGRALFQELTAGRKADEHVFLRSGVERRKRTEAGDTWASTDAARFMREACTAAKLDPLTFHELRHSYASLLVNNRCPMAYVAEQLGHIGTRMVEKHYGHLCPSAKADAIRTLMPNLGLVEASRVAPMEIKRA